MVRRTRLDLGARSDRRQGGVLVTWIGDRDFEVALRRQQSGPIANLLRQPPVPIDTVVVLHETSDEPEHVAAFKTWVSATTKAPVEYHAVEPIDDARAYSQLYPVVRDLIQRILDRDANRPIVLNGSSGRPVKHAIFMLLATPNPRLRLVSSWSDRRPVATLALPFSVAVDFARSTTAATINSFTSGRSLTREEAAAFEDIEGDSSAISDARASAASFAKFDIPVLLLGETGTGKELFAEAMHRASGRAYKKFVAINCGAIPETLIDAELFGAKRGAFTGADRDRNGLFQQADGGTLFLDEIGELPLPSQARLLRALSSTPSRVRPVGGLDEEEVDVRIVAATHRDLPRMVAEGRFREDLWYRLSTAVVRLPPLRERGADIDMLIDSLWKRLASGSALLAEKNLSAAARRTLKGHAWPGNIRELMATLTRVAVQSSGQEVSSEEARAAISMVTRLASESTILERPIVEGKFDINEVLKEVKRHYIQRALDLTAGNKSKAARVLGLGTHATLHDWMRALNMGDE